MAALARAVGPVHPDTGNAHDTLARVHGMLGNTALAIVHVRRARAVLAAFRDEPIVESMLASTTTSLAYWLATTGAYEEAEDLAREAIHLAERVGDARAVGGAWNAFGVVLRFQGRYDGAAQAYEASRAALERAGLSPSATLLHNLAGLACARDRFRDAERFARAAVASRRAAEGEGMALAMDLSGLGDALAGQRRYDEAERAYPSALANLAALLASVGRLDEARELCARAAATVRQRLAVDQELVWLRRGVVEEKVRARALRRRGARSAPQRGALPERRDGRPAYA